jgi:hypothetical protein
MAVLSWAMQLLAMVVRQWVAWQWEAYPRLELDLPVGERRRAVRELLWENLVYLLLGVLSAEGRLPEESWGIEVYQVAQLEVYQVAQLEVYQAASAACQTREELLVECPVWMVPLAAFATGTDL